MVAVVVALYCTVAPECLLLVWEFLSDLMDGGGGGGTAPLIEATGGEGFLINL